MRVETINEGGTMEFVSQLVDSFFRNLGDRIIDITVKRIADGIYVVKCRFTATEGFYPDPEELERMLGGCVRHGND